jgi:indolepyruvate ferredoxin oxidoreductase beta subunit
VTSGQFTYPPLEEILAPLKRICNKLKTIDATKLAVNAGNPQAMNVVMLGALSEHIPLREEELIEALSESVPAKAKIWASVSEQNRIPGYTTLCL